MQLIEEGYKCSNRLECQANIYGAYKVPRAGYKAKEDIVVSGRREKVI